MSDTPPPPSQPFSTREDALAVVRRLREAGHVAYFAGGCVRDALLGLTPKDYDVATDAPPPRVRDLFPRTQAVGAAFGVILVRQGRSQIEVATFRSEGKYLDGRRPASVTFTTAEEDAKRRDFTINGMFYDPVEDRVIDYVGGQADLNARVLRAIGDAEERLAEDHLRLLRAIRFAARFEFEIEPGTAQAIRDRASELKRISPERVADELRGILTLPGIGGDWGWHALLVEFPGLSDVIFRFLGSPPDHEARRTHVRVFEGFDPTDPWPFALCLAAVTLDWAILQTEPADIETLLERAPVEQMSHAMRQSLRISNDETAEMAGSLEGAGILLRDSTPRIAVLKRFLARPTSRLSRMLLDALKCYVGAARVGELLARLDELSKSDFAPPPLITGDDLTTAGLSPGPLFKKVLDDVYDAQLEGRVGTREEALALGLRVARGEG